MKRYIALLRGINVAGKNKIVMSELKKDMSELGFSNVLTYLNSGNIVFSSDTDDKVTLADRIKLMVERKYGLDIPVHVLLQDELKDILANVPDWWGTKDKEIYDNLIFIISPLTFEKFYEEIGNPKQEYEQVYNYQNAVFWSFIRKDYRKTNWWSKTANLDLKDSITIRTANTVRKIAEL